MAVTLITLIVLLGTAFGLSLARYRERPREDSRSCGAWTWARSRALLSASALVSGKKILANWIEAHYPSWTRWIFFTLAAGFVYQAASGLFFEIFIARGMFGLPLIGHMLGGGLFAASLAALLLWRGRSYRLDEEKPPFLDERLQPFARPIPKVYWRKVLFWTFAAFGFVQIATAAGSMLPVFTFETQKTLLVLHRLGALGIVVTTALFADMTFVPRRRP